jgi:hypothetical protein
MFTEHGEVVPVAAVRPLLFRSQLPIKRARDTI